MSEWGRKLKEYEDVFADYCWGLKTVTNEAKEESRDALIKAHIDECLKYDDKLIPLKMPVQQKIRSVIYQLLQATTHEEIYNVSPNAIRSQAHILREVMLQIQEQSQKTVDELRMDELDGVMHSVDKWFDEDDPRLKHNPATRSADAREIALKAIEENERPWHYNTEHTRPRKNEVSYLTKYGKFEAEVLFYKDGDFTDNDGDVHQVDKYMEIPE